MSDVAQETSVEAIARELVTRRDQGQKTVLLLGSRTGGLFGNEHLYEVLKQFSLLNFDILSNTDKFKECHVILHDHFSDEEQYNILVGTLTTLSYREEDKLLARLIKARLFSTIISTNIDSLLEDACKSSNLRKSDDYTVFVPEIDDVVRIQREQPLYTSIIKIFGDLEPTNYHAIMRIFSLPLNKSWQEYLRTLLEGYVVMVGYDPLWDQAIPQIFPSIGQKIWYINETKEALVAEKFPAILQRSNGRSLQDSRGSYVSFMRALYANLEQEIRQTIASPGTRQPSLPDTSTKNKGIFISYSHENKKYAERLKVHLKGYLRDTVDIEDDKDIALGTAWEEKTKKAIKNASIALLLVSTNYLRSSPTREESGLLLNAARKKDMTILAVIMDSSRELFSDIEPLLEYPALNGLSKPLSWMSAYEQEVVWNKLAEQVYDILHS